MNYCFSAWNDSLFVVTCRHGGVVWYMELTYYDLGARFLRSLRAAPIWHWELWCRRILRNILVQMNNRWKWAHCLLLSSWFYGGTIWIGLVLEDWVSDIITLFRLYKNPTYLEDSMAKEDSFDDGCPGFLSYLLSPGSGWNEVSHAMPCLHLQERLDWPKFDAGHFRQLKLTVSVLGWLNSGNGHCSEEQSLLVDSESLSRHLINWLLTLLNMAWY